MGMVFGKTGVAEPIFESLLTKTSAKTPYEIRKYGTRFAIETDYTNDDTGSAFRRLAGYIGVGKDPQNEGSVSIAMTAPVTTTQKSKGISIAMTAPVVTSNNNTADKKIMQFYLPSEYDSLSKIPKPINSQIRILEVPPALGVTHTFNGWASDKKAESKVKYLVEQLKEDGLVLQDKNVMESYLLWQFNPPFTIPSLRRNEIWIPLTQEQVEEYLARLAKDSD